MNLAAWLDYIASISPKTIDLGLDRIKQVAAVLGIEKPEATTFMIAGTNGKGSTVATISAILQQHGFTVGCYTSPHITHFNERITISGTPVAAAELIAAFAKVEAARGEIKLTYFEFTTLAAYVIFDASNLDAWVLEVGLGGRLDAVNIIDADITVITSIDLDHCEYLGDSREAIAVEKSAIMRPHKIAVCADLNPPAAVKAHAAAIDCRLLQINQDFHLLPQDDFWQFSSNDYSFDNLSNSNLYFANVAAAIAAVCHSRFGNKLVAATISQSLATLKLPGRFEIVDYGYKLIFDVAHNPAAAKLLAENLNANTCTGKTKAIFSVLADKDAAAIINPLANIIDEWYIGECVAQRRMPISKMRQIFVANNISIKYADSNLAQCFNEVTTSLTHKDRVVIFGSFYTVAAIKQLLEIHKE